MSNMSYCRFHNTLQDFKECAMVLEELANGEEGELSADELRAAKELAVEAFQMVMRLSNSVGLEMADADDEDMERAVDEANLAAHCEDDE